MKQWRLQCGWHLRLDGIWHVRWALLSCKDRKPTRSSFRGINWFWPLLTISIHHYHSGPSYSHTSCLGCNNSLLDWSSYFCPHPLQCHLNVEARVIPLKWASGCRPGGTVVKFVHSSSVAQSSQVPILGVDLHTAHQAMLWWHPTYKIEEDWHRC